MDERLRATDADVYAANLDFTLKELQRKVRDHQADLEKVRPDASTPHSPLTHSLTNMAHIR